MAQEAPQVTPGMRHVVITPGAEKTAPAPAKAAENPSPALIKADQPSAPLAGEAWVKKPEELHVWPHLGHLLAARSADKIEAVLKEVEKDPGAVPPQAMFYAADAFAKRGDMPKAALYFYLAQMRARFDSLRWPGDAQSGPHRAIGVLALETGKGISPWAMADGQRFANVIEKVADFDAKTPYAYDPGYRMPSTVSYADWARILDENRTAYLAESRKIAEALTATKR